MSKPFEPRLDILPAPQRRLWDELGATPKEFVLYGGTALALWLGHRKSVDFDFFSTKPFDPAQLTNRIPYLKGAELASAYASSDLFVYASETETMGNVVLDI